MISTIAVLLPPPLWGRVGERGKPHNEICKMSRLIDDDARNLRRSFFSINWAAEQVVPLSLILSHKGRGNMPADGAN
jgi:hypothetical protein